MNPSASRSKDRRLLQSLRQHLTEYRPIEVDDPELAQAAVAMIVAPDPASFLFIRRTARESDPWSGQMALPGGRMSPGDADLRATAMRETVEEVSIPLGSARYLGQLDDVAPRTPELPPLMVRPFVFQLSMRVAPQPCDHEVAHAGWLSFAELSRPGVYNGVTLELRGRSRVFPGYQLPEGLVWGMTERIVTPLLRALSLIP